MLKFVLGVLSLTYSWKTAKFNALLVSVSKTGLNCSFILNALKATKVAKVSTTLVLEEDIVSVATIK